MRLEFVDEPAEVLSAIIDETFAHGGTVVLPAFALGRTQELLYQLAELDRQGRIDPRTVFLDSPMAIDATELYRRAEDESRTFFNCASPSHAPCGARDRCRSRGHTRPRRAGPTCEREHSERRRSRRSPCCPEQLEQRTVRRLQRVWLCSGHHASREPRLLSGKPGRHDIFDQHHDRLDPRLWLQRLDGIEGN